MAIGEPARLVLFTRHPDARCPNCRRASVYFGLKEEVTGWKVHCYCERDRCSHEWKAGWVPRSKVRSTDEVYVQAREIV